MRVGLSFGSVILLGKRSVRKRGMKLFAKFMPSVVHYIVFQIFMILSAPNIKVV